MWPVPAPGTAATTAAEASPQPRPALVAAAAHSDRSTPDSFLKDGRKIYLGDCALFQAGNCPPFIGIIRWFTPGKKDHLKVGVNRLYRPSDIKLVRRNLLDTAPNEVFYSFHKDEISAELLLHPCKVAFLRKGVDLPSGISSFVCRRVYDIANECLWWLTDEDYINEQQEEVDWLLDRTLVEMHAAVQSGGRSPKQLNGPSSTQPLKSGSDSVQSSSTSYPSQAKGRKRGDKGDLGSESIKRECSIKADNGDSGNCKLESMIKAEIAKITDKGGLINSDAVERLVQLMQLDKGERKIDLAGRILLADVITATDRNDCLGRFVQLRGVPVLDDWLQEAHKGKNGDGTSPKEGDKSLEELLLALLRALDKLPVNLDALQTCNIGKSVNHLRGHRNLEIQKKARSLVDTWKKRVDAEMTKLEMTKLNDTKSVGSNQAVSWPGKSGFSEVSHGGNRRAGSSDVGVKSAIVQPSTCKSFPVKVGHGDSIVKLSPGRSGSPKLPSMLSTSMATGTKDPQSKTAGSSWTGELPLTMIKEEKSSSSSQSQNNSQSCSSDHTKSMCSTWKEDARSSVAGSMNSSKASGGTSCHRKSSTSFVGTGASGAQRDGSLGKSRSLSRTNTSEKLLQPGPVVEKTVDVPVADQGINHRLIVRLPNPGRSPARSTSGGSFEDPSLTGSRASSPGAFEKNEHIDRRTKLNSDACQANVAVDVNTESWQSNDLKGLVGSDDGDRSTAAVLDEERSSTDETLKAVDTSRGTISSGLKSGKSFEASLSSMNALIESCVKYSEASASSGGDDSGMNLLASVAAGEISKSDMVSPIGSPGGNSPALEDPCTVNEVQSTYLSDNVVTRVSRYLAVNSEDDSEKHGSITGALQVRDEMKLNGADSITNSFCDSRSVVSIQDTKSPRDCRELYPVSASAPCTNAEPTVKSERKLDAVAADGCVAACAESLSEDSARKLRKKRKASWPVNEGLSNCKRKVGSPSSEGSVPLGDEAGVDHVAPCSVKCEKASVEGTSSCHLDKENTVDEVVRDTISTDQQVHPVMEVCADVVSRNIDNAIATSSAVEVADELKKKESDDMVEKGLLESSDNEKNDCNCIAASTLDDRIGSSLLSTSNGVEKNLEKEVVQHHSSSAASHEEACVVPTNETGQCVKSTGSKLSRGKAGEVGGEVACSVEASSAAISPVLEISRNCDFDLNEGFSVDEGNAVEPVASSVPGCSPTVNLPNLQPFTVSSISTGSPALITVAAPAKGPFVPPETLLKGKGEPGWKGSAATSAFRPAEPRKVPEMPFGVSDSPSSEATSSKQCRPLLDFDLNVPDERVSEDTTSQSSSEERGSESRIISKCDPPTRSCVGLNLDLNKVDESTDNGLSGSTSRRLAAPLLPVRSACGNGGANVLRDFDLNNGPSLDEVSSEKVAQGQHAGGSTLPFLPSLRMNSNELGNLSSWFPPGNSYPAVAIPSFLPDRGDQPYPVVAAPSTQRMLSSANGCGAFGSDLYRGPVLSSSPAMAFSPAAAFPYAGFPFASTFPLATTSFSVGLMTPADSASGGGPCFPAIPTPFIGSAGAAPSPYVRPYVTSLHEGSTSSGTESNQKWAQQNLDLNSGPGGADIEGRVERSHLASRQLLVPGSQAFADEQARMYQAAGRGLKRREPDGGWDAERFKYK